MRLHLAGTRTGAEAALLDESFPEAFGDCRRPIRDPPLRIDVLEVRLHRRGTQRELLRNRLARQALCGQLQDLTLAGRQVARPEITGAAGEEVAEFLADAGERADQRLAEMQVLA